MPDWAGVWKGGRYYLDDANRKVFFIERRGGSTGRHSIRLQTHDEELAVGELARFLHDPEEYTRPPPVAVDTSAVMITKERIKLYLESIHGTVADHRAAKLSQLTGWQALGLDLRNVSRSSLRAGLASFDGGHRGRTEALNAFARFLVREGDLNAWNPLVNTRPAEATRAEREAYSLEDLAITFKRLTGPVRDLFHLRAATGMHHTELEQLEGCRLYTGPLPDKGIGLRTLEGDHEIKGVFQFIHRKKHRKERRHRKSLDGPSLEAALRLRDRVPDRVTAWEAFKPLVPSNLRHTFTTLAGELGREVSYAGAGVDLGKIARALGHRGTTTTTSDHYDKLQVPPMIVLPLGFRFIASGT